MAVSVVKTCQIVVRSMSLNKLCSEFALVTRIKFPSFPRPNLIIYKPYVTSWNGPLMHHTTAYTSHIQNRNAWVIVEYHNELWDNSKSFYTFVWATERKVQELLSKSVHVHTHNIYIQIIYSQDSICIKQRLGVGPIWGSCDNTYKFFLDNHKSIQISLVSVTPDMVAINKIWICKCIIKSCKTRLSKYLTDL